MSAAQEAPAGGKVPEGKPDALLLLVPFGKYKITRLVAGANPINGYSHFNYVFSAHVGEYHTTDRVVSFLRELEPWRVEHLAGELERAAGNRLRYKEQGGKLQLLVLSQPTFCAGAATPIPKGPERQGAWLSHKFAVHNQV